mmetsp:Transcript_51420/g.76283  ORF Transcript_51420/g.76283 Transcript_51420/m.76283 type:complete len:318 (+) Transcript_51420:43-996(+)|eukprot:CAMPEP_0195541636 /NCGR_PEP_ID=MMETSP0794_2-20130614/51189_1 /TAXON_ID=515487 /ORGANISM="Stephanopyxis turris, Strain CCMP 815" /LENGTH=317 /DNA_ID=CAMNT_0040675739 /DNA_START=43 /DNA_END=996 /DNA_ORIENTATION=+
MSEFLRAPDTGVTRHTRSKLTYSRNRLMQMALETMEIARSGKYVNKSGKTVEVSSALEKAMANSVHYHSSHCFPSSILVNTPQERKFDTKIIVVYGSSLCAASQLDGGNVGVLNSASGKNPGGGLFRGTVSQEDCLCRASLLYPCIAQFQGKKDHYYEINRSAQYKYSSSSCAIFSPHVPVIRVDSVEGELLDDFQEVSFLSIPAANAFTAGANRNDSPDPIPQLIATEDETLQGELKEAMSDRVFRILSIFAEHGCTELVLSAFGCGVHGNDPVVVAKIFKNLFAEHFKGKFKHVIFAIQPSRFANYKAFSEVFNP